MICLLGELCVKCLEGTTERSDGNRVRSARKGEARTMCLEFSCQRVQSRTCSGYAERSRKSQRSGTTPQDMPQSSALIEFVKIRATEQVAIFEAHCIRVNFFDIFGCTRHNPNKFGSALACTKIREIRGQKIRGFFVCKDIPPRTPFPTETPKNNSCFFLLKSCSFKQGSRFFLLDFHRPSPAVRPPRAQDAVAPRA